MIINRVLKVNIVYLYCVHMRRNILVRNENFFYIIYARHSKDMCAKYGRSRMNDAHTISPTDSVSRTAKVVWSTALFSKKKTIFCTTFVSATGRPT